MLIDQGDTKAGAGEVAGRGSAGWSGAYDGDVRVRRARRSTSKRHATSYKPRSIICLDELEKATSCLFPGRSSFISIRLLNEALFIAILLGVDPREPARRRP